MLSIFQQKSSFFKFSACNQDGGRAGDSFFAGKALFYRRRPGALAAFSYLQQHLSPPAHSRFMKAAYFIHAKSGKD